LVVKLSSIHVIIILTDQLDFKIHQLNVKTKFIHGVLEENIYINMLEGLKKEQINEKFASFKKLYTT